MDTDSLLHEHAQAEHEQDARRATARAAGVDTAHAAEQRRAAEQALAPRAGDNHPERERRCEAQPRSKEIRLVGEADLPVADIGQPGQEVPQVGAEVVGGRNSA